MPLTRSTALLSLGMEKLASPILRWDDSVRGFGIRINRNGTSVFILRTTVQGKKRMYTICDTTLVLLEPVRQLAMRAKILAKKGIDPDQVLKAGVCELLGVKNSAKAISFCEFSRHYIRDYSRLHKKSWRKDEQRIKCYLSAWAEKDLAEITRLEVTKLHEEIGKTRPYAANRLTEQLRHMFRQAVFMGFLPENHANPAFGIRMFREKSRDRVMNQSELESVLKEIDKLDDPSQRTALMLAFYLGFRHSEVTSLEWKNVDIASRFILLPDTKAGRPFRQPLPEQLIELLLSLPSYRSQHRYVFPSKTNREGHIARLDKAWHRVTKAAGVTGIWFHDIRRTTGSCIAEQSGSISLVGEVLNQTQVHVTAIYARFSKEHVRTALEAHAKRITSPDRTNK